MFIKYPRTEHLFGSKLLDIGNLSNNLDKQTCLFPELTNSTNHTIIIEEKMDGIGLGIGFFNAQLYIQHRGHTYFIHDPEHQRSIPYFKRIHNMDYSKRRAIICFIRREICFIW